MTTQEAEEMQARSYRTEVPETSVRVPMLDSPFEERVIGRMVPA
jgi:hypothetical protein